MLEAKINLSAEKNNHYSIIKKLGEKAVSCDKDLAREYLHRIQTIITSYPIEQLNLMAKDANKEDLLDVAHQIIKAQPELREQAKSFLISLYKRDMESDNPQYTQITPRLLTSLKKISSDEIKKFSPSLIAKNPNFFIARVDLELSKGKENKTSTLEYLANMDIPEIKQGLFDVFVKNLKSGEHTAQSFNLSEKSLRQITKDIVLDNTKKQETEEIFTKIFGQRISESIMSKIITKENYRQEQNIAEIIVNESSKVEDYLSKVDTEISRIKEKSYQFGDFTRGVFNILGLATVREDALTVKQMIQGATSYLSSWVFPAEKENYSSNISNIKEASNQLNKNKVTLSESSKTEIPKKTPTSPIKAILK